MKAVRWEDTKPAGPRAEPGLGYSGAGCVTRAEPCGDAR